MRTFEAGSSRLTPPRRRWFRAGGLGIAIAATLATVGCATAAETPGADTLTVGWLYASGVAQTYDPAVDGYPGDSIAQQCVYDTLLHFDATKDEWIHFEPGLATDWTVAPDLTWIELELRQGVTFTDGEIFDAEATKAIMEYLITNAALPVESIDVVDEYRVRVNFAEPLSVTAPGGMLPLLGEVQVVSPEAIKDRDALVENPVGTGPYTLNKEETTLGVEYVCERIDDYWDAESYPFKTIVVRQYADVVGATNALKSGQIDMTAIDATVAAELEGDGFNLIKGYPAWSGLVLGDKTGQIVPALADVRVRQAMNYAFDRQAIAEALDGGYSVPTNQVYNETWPEYRPDRVDDYAFDLDRARELMAEAGYADGFDLVLPAYGGTATTGSTKYDPIIAQSLAEIGIRVTFEPRTWEQQIPDLEQSRYAVSVWFSAAYTITTRLLVDKGVGPFNPWPTGETVTAELLEEVRFGDAEESRAASEELGDYLMDEAWFVPLTSPQSLWATKPGVTARFLFGLPPLLSTLQPE